jgi:hypothetical protein
MPEQLRSMLETTFDKFTEQISGSLLHGEEEGERERGNSKMGKYLCEHCR